jgi:hypothetical protein
VNLTPVEWFSKRQNTVETATYGSEFVVSWTATEQIIDLCYTICMLGVPLDGPAWMFGNNNAVETATYGSEFVVAWTATEQIIDLCYTICMLGVPLDGPAWMYGDNESVVKSATIPHLSLMKRHNALAYHRVCKAIAAKNLHFCHISGN